MRPMGALTRRRFARNLCLRPLRLAREAGGGGKMHRSTYRASPEYPDGSTIGPHISRHRRLQHMSSHFSSTTENLTAPPVGQSALTGSNTACTVNVSSTPASTRKRTCTPRPCHSGHMAKKERSDTTRTDGQYRIFRKS